ncbi:MAG TPA: hypothetical protein V6C76_04315 [Drouetiella sp.]
MTRRRRRKGKPEQESESAQLATPALKLKAAAGGGGSRGGSGGGGAGTSGFRAGQSIVCEVLASQPGGYSVQIEGCDMEAFLPTQALLRVGEELNAQFVCVSNQKVLVTARFSNNSLRLVQPLPPSN